MKKLTLVMILLFFGNSLVLSQDLVKAAQKEKQRRAQLKKRSAIVVTNDDLGKTNSERTDRISSPQENSRNTQRTTPQQRLPTQQVDSVDQIDLRVDSVEQVDQLDARGFGRDYASRVLYANELVRNPASALNKPDGRYAEIPILGIIDLEISAKNGPGDDIAIYAMQTGAKEMLPGGEEDRGISELSADFQYWGGLWYGILGMDEQGNWVAIGKGTGTSSPEIFDLAELSSIKKIRIMFRPHTNADQPVKWNRRQPSESFFGIDAVQTLHK